MEWSAPGSGAHFNEVFKTDFDADMEGFVYFEIQASSYKDNPQHIFFGSHNDRLRDIKDKYDPEGMFVVAGGVGSDEWDGSLNCCR